MTRLAAPGLTWRHADWIACVHATCGLHGGSAESGNLEKT